jgi:hypothetical protein
MTIAYTKPEIGEGGVIPYTFPLGAMRQSLKIVLCSSYSVYCMTD